MNLPNSANSMYNIVKWYFDHFIPPYGTINTRRSKRLCGFETCSDWGFFCYPVPHATVVALEFTWYRSNMYLCGDAVDESGISIIFWRLCRVLGSIYLHVRSVIRYCSAYIDPPLGPMLLLCYTNSTLPSMASCTSTAE
jgi:hypothetical protein